MTAGADEVIERFGVEDATYEPGDDGQLGACECELTLTRLRVRASTGRVLDLPLLDIVHFKPRTKPFVPKLLVLSTQYSRLTFRWSTAEPVYVIGQRLMDLVVPLREQAEGGPPPRGR